MKTKHDVTNGYVYVSSNGQLIVDEHPTDEGHLLAAPEHDVPPIHTCRTYLRDLIPEEWRGRLGEFSVCKITNDDGRVVAVQFSFTSR